MWLVKLNPVKGKFITVRGVRVNDNDINYIAIKKQSNKYKYKKVTNSYALFVLDNIKDSNSFYKDINSSIWAFDKNGNLVASQIDSAEDPIYEK